MKRPLWFLYSRQHPVNFIPVSVFFCALCQSLQCKGLLCFTFYSVWDVTLTTCVSLFLLFYFSNKGRKFLNSSLLLNFFWSPAHWYSMYVLGISKYMGPLWLLITLLIIMLCSCLFQIWKKCTITTINPWSQCLGQERKNIRVTTYLGTIIQNLLKIVNSAVNVCSNLIGCFEVVPLAPAPTII